MKFKILVGISITLITVTAIIATASKSENVNNDIQTSFPEDSEESIQKLNKRLNTDKKNSRVESINQSKSSLNPSILEMAGPVHNQYGIRDDILKYIEKKIPPENGAAMKAVIKYASSLQFIYYQATKEEALKASKSELIALHCLHSAYPDKRQAGENDGGFNEISKNIEDLMRNTPQREKHMRLIAENYFGWKILGFGNLTNRQLKLMCDSGDY